MSVPGHDVSIGRTLGGKYRLDAFLSAGSMGSVYRATQLALEKPVAVKLLHRALGADPKYQERFRREALAASRLNHTNSVAVLDFGVEHDGTMFIAMELVEGRDLHSVIYDDWPLSTERVVGVMAQALAALAEAHEAGIVHRDLKPENILVATRRGDDEGELVDLVKVADFGVAKLISRGPADGSYFTSTGLIPGTPEYMSPEHARGQEIDGRSDLFACGVILYQMVTGKLPFEDDSAVGVLAKVLHEPVVPP